MKVTVTRNFQIEPFHMHTVQYEFNETDFPEIADRSPINRAIFLRNVATDLVNSEEVIWGNTEVGVVEDKLKNAKKRTESAQNQVKEKVFNY